MPDDENKQNESNHNEPDTPSEAPTEHPSPENAKLATRVTVRRRGKPSDADAREMILEAAKIGMPWKIIAQFVGMTLSELSDLRHADRELTRAIFQARAECMHELLAQLATVKQWQAITFILESRWPEHFGRNRKRKKKSLLVPEPSEVMLNALSPEEFIAFRNMLDKMHAARKENNARRRSNRPARSPDKSADVHQPGVADPRTDNAVCGGVAPGGDLQPPAGSDGRPHSRPPD